VSVDLSALDREVASLRLEVDVLKAIVDGVRDPGGKVTSPGLKQRVRLIERRFETADTSCWRRLLFRLDRWGPWYRDRARPGWTPWRRWFTS